MVIPVVAKHGEGKRPDVGQYFLFKKRLELWYNSDQNMVNTDPIVIPEFEMPKDVEKIRLIDTKSPDVVMSVPVDVFKKSYVEGKGYQFVLKDWRNKYRLL